MKYLPIIVMLISLNSAEQDLAGKKKKTDHATQKKQFVNFINDDGEYTRNYVDLTNNEANGFDDIFRGRGNGGALIDGTMQLTENTMGGLALDGDDMEGAYNQLSGGPTSFVDPTGMGNGMGQGMGDQRIVHVFPALRRRLRRLFICRGNSDLQVRKLRMKCASSTLQSGQPLPDGQDMSSEGINFNAPSFFGTFDVNTGSEDILSPFYSSEGKLEDNINLSDTMSNSGHIDMASFNEALQGLNDKDQSLMKGASKNKAMQNQDNLGSEIGDMDSADEKLQKLLEASIENNNGDTGEDPANSATVGSFLSALLSQGNMNNEHAQHVQSSQTSTQEENQGNVYENSQANQMQLNALNQLSGTIAQNGMGSIQPVTVHVHASDKPGHKNSPPPPEQSRAVAQQAQEIAMKQHKAKLAKLKKRLALLREKLTELEDEQAKKSTSNKSNDPKQARNDAIKKLLIKNLKLAALIASKEIQLEEEKSRGLEFLSGKKEDGNLFEDIKENPVLLSKFTKSKPLTELSKKAEEEVNHLSNSDRLRSNTSFNISPIQNDTSSASHETFVGKSTLSRINETLQALDSYSTPVSERSVLAGTSEVFLNKLRKQIHSMSLDQVRKAKVKEKV